MELGKCLVVDDDLLGREIVVQYVKNVPVVDTADAGREALEKFRSALDSGVPYELILLDIVMPDMDGISVGKEIRKIEKEQGVTGGKQVKIIMVTSQNSTSHVMQAMLSAQSSAYLIKPVTCEKVIKTIGQLGFRVP